MELDILKIGWNMQLKQLNNKIGSSPVLKLSRVMRASIDRQFYNFKVGCNFLFLCCNSKDKYI